MMSVLLVVALVVSLVVSAFCSGAETGFLSVSRDRVLHMARQGGKRAQIVYLALSNISRSTSALLVGNNLVAVGFSTASAALAARVFPDSPVAQMVWSAVAAITVLYLGEFLPKLFCSTRPLRRTLALAYAWRAFERVFGPLGVVVQAIVSRLLPRREPRTQMTPETVLRILEDRKDGVKLSDFESALVGRLMVLRAKGASVTPETLLSVLDDEFKEEIEK